MRKINRLRLKQAKLNKPKSETSTGAVQDPSPGYSVVKVAVSFLTADPDAVLNTRTTTIVYSLTDNAPYATLATDLPAITTANDAFADAIAAASDGGKSLNAAKNAARAALVDLLRPMAGRVQLLCQNNMTILLSSGFPVQKPNRTPAQTPATPSTPDAMQGLTGQVLLASSPVNGAYIYNWRVATVEEPDKIVFSGQSTGARTDFTGLTPGKTYLFQLNAVGTAGTSDWSNASSLMVI